MEPTHKCRPANAGKITQKTIKDNLIKLNIKRKRKKDKKMTMIVALIGVATLGLLAANVVSGYTMEAVGANA